MESKFREILDIKEALGKLIRLMSFDMAQERARQAHSGRSRTARHERNPYATVRPESTEKTSQSFLDGVVQKEFGLPVGEVEVENPCIRCRDVNVYYGSYHAIRNVSLDIRPREVLALLGPSGCGKSTLLRCFNRMNDPIPGCRVSGKIEIDGVDIYGPSVDVVSLRAQVGMVFQKPNPFPRTIYENVAYGPRIHRLAESREELDHLVKGALKRAGLWQEVKHRLGEPATTLSSGQQQRLCIARALAIRPAILLMDEPCSSLDPIAAGKIEHLIDQLRSCLTIVTVTHSAQQAARISQRTAYFHLGHLVEVGDTEQILTHPRHPLTEAYLTGRIG